MGAGIICLAGNVGSAGVYTADELIYSGTPAMRKSTDETQAAPPHVFEHILGGPDNRLQLRWPRRRTR